MCESPYYSVEGGIKSRYNGIDIGRQGDDKRYYTVEGGILKAYCGMKKTAPKGSELATPLECMQMNQVRRYGRYKIDKKYFHVNDYEHAAIKLHKMKYKVDDDKHRLTQVLSSKEESKIKRSLSKNQMKYEEQRKLVNKLEKKHRKLMELINREDE